MSQSFAFPANPTLNQIVVLPDGNSAQWNGYAWVSVANNVTYPLSIPNGGTGATAPSTARTNLGINTATGEFVITKDGTVTAPGMQWLSEPGLGWYRRAAGIVGMAASGALAFDFNTAAAATALSIFPRAAGTATLYLNNQPSGTANFSQARLMVFADGSVQLSSLAGGTGALGSIYMTPGSGNVVVSAANAGNTNFSINSNGTGQAVLSMNKSGSAQANNIWGYNNGSPRWVVQVGSEAAESTGNAGSDFILNRYADNGTFLGNVLNVNRASGNFGIGGTASIGSTLTVGSSLTLQGTSAYTLWQDNTWCYFQYAGGWNWTFNKPSGNMYWNRYGGTNPTTFAANGDFFAGQDLFAGTDAVFGLIKSDPNLKYVRFSANNWRLSHEVATGNLSYVSFQGTILWTIGGGGGMNNVGNHDLSGYLNPALGIKCRQGNNGGVGGNTYHWFWNTDNHLYAFVDASNQGWPTFNSDERIKRNIGLLDADTDGFLALVPITYEWAGVHPYIADGVEHWGFSAQNVKRAMPKALIGDIEAVQENGDPQPASVDTTVILAQTVLQVQNLMNRVKQLELH